MSDKEIQSIARVIYMTHQGKILATGRQAPIWDNASKEIQSYVIEQAKEAIRELDRIRS